MKRRQTFQLICDVMGFKLILDPLEAKIQPSEIFQKMKKFTFMSTFEPTIVKSTMGLSSLGFFLLRFMKTLTSNNA
jgi:hypothetical protein